MLTDGGNTVHSSGGSDSGSGGGTGGDSIGLAGSLSIGSGSASAFDFDVEPNEPQTVTVDLGASSPTVSFEALLDGEPIAAAWSVDRGDVATITLGASKTGVVTPTGLVGGRVLVTAGLNDNFVQREVLVQIRGTQNGADTSVSGQVAQIPADVPGLTSGGGPGGVGGEGLGVAVSDQDLLDELANPTGNAASENLRFVYPYDGTVFPRGILAPLLAWDWSVGDADAVRIHLETESGSFGWTGTFGRPEILAQTGGKFVQHPIPQNVWEVATNTASGKSDKLKVSLTVASGGVAYGPLEQSWVIAPARLSGTIYYNSYGTNLAKNYTGALGGDGSFGGATLGIRVGDTGPTLVAGASGNAVNCRVCHSVSADGSRLVSSNQGGSSFSYDLLAGGGATETQMGTLAEFPGVYPDGSMALAASGQLLPLPDGGTPLAATGLDSIATNVGTPMFSPDGQKVAFNPMASSTITNAKQKLVVADFDPSTLAFSNPMEVVDYSGEPAQTRPGWPAFFPDGKSLVFHSQSAAGLDNNSHGDLRTRKGARAQIHWTSLGGPDDVTPLNQLNGLDQSGSSYLPQLSSAAPLDCTGDGAPVGNIDTSHEDDANLNYEPTVNPVAGGGYAWVVFTSRRRYAHVATIPPFCSDPRGVDLIQNVTPKKLWVAAVDLNAEPGTDASHPAFYLPGQELLAGNSRAFWVLDPCRANGDSCESGDQCCLGYCQPDSSSGALVCANEPPDHSCSELQERCETGADCCDPGVACIGGFCALPSPR